MNATLLILAAGMGSRYGGLKQLDPMGPHGEWMMDYSVFDAVRAGFNRVVFVIRRDFENEFREAVGKKYEKITDVGYVFQELGDLPGGHPAPAGRSKPWGTSHAIWCARNEVRSPFLCINADDFYGADAYGKLVDFLGNLSVPSGQPLPCSMAGFRLGNTLSEHGTVSRGLCRTSPDGLLESIEEVTAIQPMADGSIVSNAVNFAGKLSPEIPVSMNFWGFPAEIFPLLEEEIAGFLADKGRTDPKVECFIPESVGNLVKAGKATVRVLDCSAHWFGVTYPEDKSRVVDSVAKLVEDGHYPSPLW
jgi:hypothetical protein